MTNDSVDVTMISYSPEHLYSMYEIQPMNELLTEYLVCKKALDSFLISDSDFLVNSPVREYLDGIVQIIRMVVVDRSCVQMGISAPAAAAAAAMPPHSSSSVSAVAAPIT